MKTQKATEQKIRKIVETVGLQNNSWKPEVIKKQVNQLMVLFNSSTQSAVRKAEERMPIDAIERINAQLGLKVNSLTWESQGKRDYDTIKAWLKSLVKNHSKQGL